MFQALNNQIRQFFKSMIFTNSILLDAVGTCIFASESCFTISLPTDSDAPVTRTDVWL
jgi:hypothetical protein